MTSNMRWKRPFQENKDWNFAVDMELEYRYLWKRPFQENKDWNTKTFTQIGFSFQWKRPFQENKDWNQAGGVAVNFYEIGESAHSKKTRIETVKI